MLHCVLRCFAVEEPAQPPEPQVEEEPVKEDIDGLILNCMLGLYRHCLKRLRIKIFQQFLVYTIHYTILLEEDPCEENQCLNGGTCLPEKDDFRCFCIDGFKGKKCEISKCRRIVSKVDILKTYCV